MSNFNQIPITIPNTIYPNSPGGITSESSGLNFNNNGNWLTASSQGFPAFSDPTNYLPSLPPVSQGAQIDQTRIGKTFYVDNNALTGIGISSGTQAQPFISIQQALNVARADVLSGTGVRIIINSGVYREELYIEGNGSDNAPLIIEAAEFGKVLISGADVFTGWQSYQSMPGVYQHPWTKNWGPVENPWRSRFGQGNESAYPDFRREMFYLDGKPLSQALRVEDLRPGSFFVDEALDRVLLWTPTGIDINSVLVEGAVRSENLDFGVFKTYQLNNLALKGLTITQGSGPIWGAARLSGNNILIEDSHFDRNNGMGLTVNGNNITIRRTTANENGHAGIQMFGGSSVLVEQSEASWNGWKMKEWGYTDTSGAGMKFVDARNILARDLKFVGNSYPGLWFDEGCVDVTVDNVLTFANASAGFDWEISNNLKVSRLYSIYNQFGWRSFDGSQVSLENSVIAFNRSLQLFTANTDRPYDNERWTVRGVTIAANAGNQNLLWDTWPHEPGSYQVGPNNTMDKFASTFLASNNVYFHPTFTGVFRSGNGLPLSLVQWQSYTGQETGSVWDSAQVGVTMENLKTEIFTKWGYPSVNALGYHSRPQLPW